MLQELAARQLWIAEMPAQKMGFEYGARMTVVRLPDGGLFLHSPIELGDPLKRELDALGPVRAIISPTRFHITHVPEFARAYPEARIYAAPGSESKLKGLLSPGVLGDTPEPAWAEVVDQAVFRGSSLYDEVDFFHWPSGTLILTDLLFNIPTNRSWTTRVMAAMLGVLGRPSPSRSFRWTMRDKAAIRASLERILAWDFDRIILSHGDFVETGGKAVFRRAFAWLLE
jgi:hypothetical protein